MPDKAISRTAFGVAYTRAAHLLIDSEPWILNDYIAAEIIGKNGVEKIISSKEYYQQIQRLYLRSHVLLRSRFTEDCLREAVIRGIRQYIILGAGLDSFAYRQPDWAEKLRIFEVDSHETQTAKKQILSKNRIILPGNLSFVSIDFEKESLEDGLKKTWIDFNVPTFVSWLGVTMYLSLDSIRAVFDTIHLFLKGSEIVFTYSNKIKDKSIFEDRAEDLGEKWKSKFSDEEIAKLLIELNYTDTFFLTPEEIEKRYFKNRVDKLPVPKINSIVSTRVG